MITATEARTMVSNSAGVRSEILERISKHIKSAALEGYKSIEFAEKCHPGLTQSIIDSLRKHGFGVTHKTFDHTLDEVFVNLTIHW